MAERPTSGIPGVDRLVDGLRRGDNVVWMAPRRLWDSLLTPFIEAAADRGLCYMAVDSPAEDVLTRLMEVVRPGSLTMLDCHARSAGAPQSPDPSTLGGVDLRVVEDPHDLGSVQVAMKEIEDALPPGIGYVFESLTAMQQLWDADGALAFFLRHCPRLYDLDTVAYWVLDPAEHDQAFIERIKQITQVILEVTGDDVLTLRVVKADARPADVVGRTATVRESPSGLVVHPTEPAAQPAVGVLLKRRRMERGMSQTELARRLGVTPSALSQAEHGKRGLSAQTMKVAWRELGVDEDPDIDDAPPSYVIARRGARRLERIAPGIEGEKVIEQPTGLEVHMMTFAPGSSGRRSPIPTKRPEFVLVTEGVLQLRIGDSKEVLHAGDAIYIGTQPLNGWRNPSPTVTRVFWVVLP